MDLIKILNRKDRELVISRFKKGDVGVILTDTIYGLSCLADNFLSVNKIYRIKNRSKNNSFIFLVSDFLMLKKYFLISKDQEIFLRKNWLDNNLRPTTFILDVKDGFKKKFGIKQCGGVAVRLPKNDFLVKIIRSLGLPLISTSCNLSGQKEINNLREIISLFKFNKYKPDFLVNYNKTRPRKKSSRIIDIRELPVIKLIRS